MRKKTFFKRIIIFFAIMLLSITVLPLRILANDKPTYIIAFVYPDASGNEGQDTEAAVVTDRPDSLPDMQPVEEPETTAATDSPEESPESLQAEEYVAETAVAVDSPEDSPELQQAEESVPEIASAIGSPDGLPETLRAIVYKGNEKEVEEDIPVEWACDDFDTDIAGEYRFEAVLGDKYLYTGTMPHAIVQVSEKPEEPKTVERQSRSLGMGAAPSAGEGEKSGESAGELTAKKTARVLPDGKAEPGTAEAPVRLQLGDTIEYSITVDNSIPASYVNPAYYDIVFALDWSNSMNRPYVTSGEKARVLAKDTIMNMSERLFANYPNSRIAVMGLNAYENNKYVNSYLFLQIDTDFVGSEGYETTIKNAFYGGPAFQEDDNPAFLRAATDKLSGNKVLYGASLPNTTNRKYVNVRTDKSRIPVVVLISDFQPLTNGALFWPKLGESADYFNSSLANEGIFLAVRTDHMGNYNEEIKYNTPQHDAEMEKIIAKGDGRWQWVKFTHDMSYDEQNELLWQTIGDYVPKRIDVPATIADVLPEGLEYISSTNGGKLGADGRTVEWILDDLPDGESTVKITAKVKDVGTFVNQATANIEDVATASTNKTYHYATYPQASLRIKNVIGNIGDFGAPGSDAYSDLAGRAFAISVSGGAKGSVALKHNETSGTMKIDVDAGVTVVNISEIVPMEFSEDYQVIVEISEADGNSFTITSKQISILPADDITVTVINTYKAKPFFKAHDMVRNIFK